MRLALAEGTSCATRTPARSSTPWVAQLARALDGDTLEKVPLPLGGGLDTLRG